MKRVYENPFMEIVNLHEADIIRTSDGYDPDNDGTEILMF